MITIRKTVLQLAIFLIASVALALAQNSGTYTTIDYPGAKATIVEGINTAGDMVGQFVDSSNETHGFLFSGGVFTQLDVPGTNTTWAYGINDVGQVVGGTNSSLGLFIYDIATQTYTTYQYTNGGAYVNTTGAGINNAGVVVGYTQRNGSGQYAGLVLNGSTFTRVIVPNAYSTQLTGINNAGQIIARATSKSGASKAYLMANGKPRQIAIPNHSTTLAVGINDQGTIVGIYEPNIELGFLWLRPGFDRIDVPDSIGTAAAGLNNMGQVVGSYDSEDEVVHGFLWTPSEAVR